ncbi:MAG: 50S ribosomal protein L21 [Clostridiaceae bacterium]|nr:50S ribosomal protein L21 [Clostridiaceae bacterium]
MYAIIKTGGKQYKVTEGDEIFIEKLEGEAGDTVNFNEVLAVSKDEGLSIGSPFVENATVSGEIVKHGKGKKIVIFKYKPKKTYRNKTGHRQPYTKVKINSIG